MNGCSFDPSRLALLIDFSLTTTGIQTIYVPNTLGAPLALDTLMPKQLLLTLPIGKPEIIFVKIPGDSLTNFKSNDQLSTTYKNQVWRYYAIEPMEGVTDYFSIRMNIENDVSVLKIEAYDTIQNISYTIFSNLQNPLPPDKEFTMVFYNPNSTTATRVLPSMLAPLTDPAQSAVGVSLENVLFGSQYNYLYLSSLTNTRNTLLIRELVRMDSTSNCRQGESNSTKYTLKTHCNENYSDTIQCGLKKEFYLDFLSEYIGPSLSRTPAKFNSTTGTYQAFIPGNPGFNMGLKTCGAPGDSGIDYTVFIQNIAAVSPPFAAGSGTVILDSVSVDLNRKIFDFDSISYGTLRLDTTMYYVLPDTLQNRDKYIFSFKNSSLLAALDNYNPNPLGNVNGVSDRLNDFFPDASTRAFIYLKENHSIGITFHNLRLKECVLPTVLPSELLLTQIGYLAGISICSSKTSVSANTSYWETKSLFGGYAYGLSNPTDMTSGITVSQLTFTYTPVDSIRDPLSAPTSKFDNSELFACPNRRNYAVLVIPNHLYFPDTLAKMAAEIRNSFTNTVIAANVVPVILNNDTSHLYYYWNGSQEGVILNFNIYLKCDTSFGLDTFNLEFRQACDTNCFECGLVYGKTAAYIYRHCQGECLGIPVGTKNLLLRRITGGWVDEQDYKNSPTQPAITNLNTERGYPHDIFRLESLNGSISFKDSTININDSIFFELTAAQGDFRAPLLRSFFKCFENGRFIFSISDPNVTCDTFGIAFQPADLLFRVGPNNDSDKYVLQFPINLNDSVLVCNTTTSFRDVLHNFNLNVSFLAKLEVDMDASFSEGYDLLNVVFGKFSAKTIYGYFPSCDPYTAKVTLLKPAINLVTNQVVAPYKSTVSSNPCLIGYQMEVSLTGGFPGTPDFPQEFRPLISFPDSFEVSNNALLDFNRQEYKYPPVSVTNRWNISPTNNQPGSLSYSINTASNVVPLVWQKENENRISFYVEYNHDCTSSTYFDPMLVFPDSHFTIRSGLYAPLAQDTLITLDTVSYKSIERHYINFSLGNVNAITVPSVWASGHLEYKCDSCLTTTVANYPYLYFTSQTNNFIAFVKNVAGTIITPISSNGLQIFPFDPFTRNKTVNYQASFSWDTCMFLPNGQPDTIRLMAHTGILCGGYHQLLDSNFVFPGCQEDSFPISIVPVAARISVVPLDSNVYVSGCDSLTVSLKVTSFAADVFNPVITFSLPPGIYPGTAGITIESLSTNAVTQLAFTTSVNGIYSINLTNALAALNLDSSFNIFDGSLLCTIPLRAGYQSYPPAANLTIPFDFYGWDACGSKVSDNTQPVNVQYSNPPAPIEITTQDIVSLCQYDADTLTVNGDSVNAQTSLFWSSGQINTKTVIVSQQGTYTVLALYQNGCLVQDTAVLNCDDFFGVINPLTTPCYGAPLTLVAQTYPPCISCNYQWSNGATGDSLTINTAYAVPVYSVTITNGMDTAFASFTLALDSSYCCVYNDAFQQSDIPHDPTQVLTFYNHQYNLTQDLIITGNVTFDSVDISIWPGRQIIIDEGSSLTLRRSTLTGCSQMWKGIIMMESSQIHVLEDSKIQDAEMAIMAAYKCGVEVRQSSLENNVKGVYYPPLDDINSAYVSYFFTVSGTNFGQLNSGWKPPYPTQGVYAERPMSGVELNNLYGVTVGGAATRPNYFHNMGAGIIGRSGSLTVNNGLFERILYLSTSDDPGNSGVAIGGYGYFYYPLKPSLNALYVNSTSQLPVTIRNSRCGIATEYSDLLASAVNMDTVRLGINVRDCHFSRSAMINNCTINAQNVGIQFIDNSGARKLQASNNNITIKSTRPDQGFGMKVFETGTDTNQVMNLAINDITLTRGVCGIFMNAAVKADITSNLIKLESHFRINDIKGIQLEGTKQSNVSCNMVYDLLPLNTSSFGLGSSVTTDDVISCNTFSGTETGVHFAGPCGQVDFKGNLLNNNRLGLELNSNATIGVQEHKGNRWLNQRGVLGAKNLNGPGAQQSVFKVHIPAGTSMYSPYVDPAPWFFPEPGSPKPCNNTCKEPYLRGSITLDEAIANGQIDAIDFSMETRNRLKLYLYQRLLEDPSLLSNDSLMSFYTGYSDSLVAAAALSNVQLLENLALTTQAKSNFNLLDSLILITTDSLVNFNALQQINNWPAPEAMIESITLRLKQFIGARNQIIINYTATRNDSLENLAAYFTPGVAGTLPDENQLALNAHLVNYEVYGDSIVAANYNLIYDIANQCPLSGGPAVYQARTLISLINDTIEYNDAANCLLAGYYRTGIVNATNSNFDFKIVPNPNNGQFTVEFANPIAEFSFLEVYNAQGILIKKERIAENISDYPVNLNVACGIYLVRITTGSLFGTQKFIKQ